MRLEGQAKAGFYPTPLEVARLIGSCLVTEGNSHLLDPCCGEGKALEKVRLAMQGYARNTTHGVELEQGRAQEAALELDNVLVGDSLKVRARGGFSLLYLNPPYDQADGKRLELKFLWHWQRALLPGGVLVYVVPEKYLPECQSTLTAQFENLSIYRFPDEQYDAFKQVVVFGVKRATPSYPSSLPELAGDLSLACARYVVPEGKDTPQLYLTGQDPEVLVAEARTKGCWRRAWDLLSPPDPQAFRPLLPLRKGHVALMMASGLLNNTVVEADGRRLLVRGRVRKEVVSYDEEDDKGVKHIERDVIKTEVTALDLDTAELIEVA
jgi:SAM-dependent methyltransferase